MNCYIITDRSPAFYRRIRKVSVSVPPRSRSFRPAASTPRPVAVSIPPSVLRLGLPARLTAVAVVLGGIWALIGWTLK